MAKARNVRLVACKSEPALLTASMIYVHRNKWWRHQGYYIKITASYVRMYKCVTKWLTRASVVAWLQGCCFSSQYPSSIVYKHSHIHPWASSALYSPVDDLHIVVETFRKPTWRVCRKMYVIHVTCRTYVHMEWKYYMWVMISTGAKDEDQLLTTSLVC